MVSAITRSLLPSRTFGCKGDRYVAFGCKGDWYVAAAESPAMYLSPWQPQSQLADCSNVVFNKDAELLIVAHQGTTNLASVFNSGAAQFAAGIGQIGYTSWVALYIALLGGLAYAQHDLPPKKGAFFKLVNLTMLNLNTQLCQIS
jgi:hypothetical protein